MTETTGHDYAAKVQALLANAESYAASADPADHTVAAKYRAMAEKLMDKYRIAEEEVLAADPTAITLRAYDIRLYSNATDMGHWYTSVWGAIARHTGIRYRLRWDRGYVTQAVGYEGDVRYAEFLWTSALLMFSTRIDPRWDDTLPEAENVYRLRAAGWTRGAIADRAWGNDAGRVAANRSKVQRIYVAECSRRGEEPSVAGLGFNAGDYREGYARSFRDTLEMRLREARDAADSVGGGLVLHGRAERVQEAFYTIFPSERPVPRNDTPTEPAGPCPRCAAAKSGHCRQHPASYLTKAERERWQRRLYGTSAEAGGESGRRAAEGVVIQRGHTRAQRLDDGPIIRGNEIG